MTQTPNKLAEKTISAQLRAYNEKFPPSTSTLMEARERWAERRQSRVAMSISISDQDVKRYLARRARNDNRG